MSHRTTPSHPTPSVALYHLDSPTTTNHPIPPHTICDSFFSLPTDESPGQESVQSRFAAAGDTLSVSRSTPLIIET
jgi:hypothetical protein